MGIAMLNPFGFCSYRTYEEWKRFSWFYSCYTDFGSYRTYEEWKLGNNFFNSDGIICSYRTYEEWKQQCTQ